MGERLLCKQEVIGSIPFTSTNKAVSVEARVSRPLRVSGSGKATICRHD